MKAEVIDQSADRVNSLPNRWIDAANLLTDLRRRQPLQVGEWEVIVNWLLTTEFDDRSYLAGEVGAGLIRDFAPSVIKERIRSVPPSNRWLGHFQSIIASPINRSQEL